MTQMTQSECKIQQNKECKFEYLNIDTDEKLKQTNTYVE